MASKAAKPLSRTKKNSATRTHTTTSNAGPNARTGIEVIDATESDPGMPDAIDVAEAARLSPEAANALSGGDLDASFAGLDSGEEAVGGSDPLPDQNDVDRIGSALGVEEQDEKPLATTEKIEGRDRDRWELDPGSADDYELRQEDESVRRRQHRA